jgi:hypothetical protein
MERIDLGTAIEDSDEPYAKQQSPFDQKLDHKHASTARFWKATQRGVRAVHLPAMAGGAGPHSGSLPKAAVH